MGFSGFSRGKFGNRAVHTWGTVGAHSWGTKLYFLGHTWGKVGAKSYLGHTWGTLGAEAVGAHLGQKLVDQAILSIRSMNRHLERENRTEEEELLVNGYLGDFVGLQTSVF